MQRLAAALEQALVGRVLDQRVLEAIFGLRRRALDKQEVGFGEPIQRRLQRRLVESGDVPQQPVGEFASQHRADLRDFARLPSGRGARRAIAARSAGWPDAALSPRSSSSRVTSSTNSGTPPVRSLTPSINSLGERVARRDFADHARDPGAIEGRERNRRYDASARSRAGEIQDALSPTTSSGACAPRSASARNRSSDVGSAQCRSSKARTTGCDRAPARTQAIIAASCLRRNSSGGKLAARPGGRGMSTSGASRGAYSAGSRPINRNVFSRSARRCSAGASSAKTQPAPFGDRMQRRVLQELRGAPFDPGVRRLREPRVELLDQPRLAEAGFADDQHELAFASRARVPAARQQRRVPPRDRRMASAPARRPVGRRRSRARCGRAGQARTRP